MKGGFIIRLIDAETLKSEIGKEYDLSYGEILINPVRFYDMVDDALTIDATPVVNGHWIEEPNGLGKPRLRCSACGNHDNKTTAISGHYCWFCGAKMSAKETFYKDWGIR